MVHFRSRGIGLEQCIQLMKNSRNGTIWFHGEREKNTKLFFYHYLTDPSRISKITYYKTKKGVKETDFISSLTDNSFNLFDFIVSEETYKLLLESNLPIYNKIQAYIPEFSTQREYFLLGFPELSLENVDYAHSVILDSFSGDQLRINSYEEYANRTYKFTKMHNIQLKADYKYDIIKLQNTGLFFSNSLIEVMRLHNITGLDYLTQSIILPV